MSDKEQVYSCFEEEVWETLSRIDVEPHIDSIKATAKRPEVKYLSWSKAWTLLLRNFPGSTYAHRGDIRHPDETVETEVDVCITRDGSQTRYINARLAVMDFYFGPISNPTAREVNDTRQRTLVKALAFAGLGLNLWSDSAIPVGKQDDRVTPDEIEEINTLIKETDSDKESFLEWAGVDEVADMTYPKFVSGKALLQSKLASKKAKEKAKGGKK